MTILVGILSLMSWIVVGLADDNQETPDVANLTDPNKDMYVIHAMVYQVGILTNKTDDEAANASIAGNQETVTFYRSNGSNIDLSNIPDPLQTNVTAQTLVGVAPISGELHSDKLQLPWSAPSRHAKDQQVIDVNQENKRNTNENRPFLDALYKRSVDISKIERDNETVPVKVLEGTSVIPREAGVQSIAIPPLITLNNNFSEIPVPIPNTSIVRYAKINTLVHDMP